MCLACSLTCHEGHELYELYTKRNFQCDCGNEKFPKDFKCQLFPVSGGMRCMVCTPYVSYLIQTAYAKCNAHTFTIRIHTLCVHYISLICAACTMNWFLFISCQDKSPSNEENQYNHNFRGVYCTCCRPYPDPDDDVSVCCHLCAYF